MTVLTRESLAFDLATRSGDHARNNRPLQRVSVHLSEERDFNMRSCQDSRPGASGRKEVGKWPTSSRSC